jgi:V/A-type H+-transporting ATPase subunit I
MAIAMGILQVFLGLILGVWGAVRERHLGEVGEKVGALVGLVAVFALLGVVAGRLPEAFFTPFVVLLLVGIVLLSVPMGLIGVLLGPLELLGTIGNILSYLRIAAIGLSSVYLAMVANEMAGLMGNIVLGAVVAGLFHVLNIALGIVSPTIQALRLHYVEFFSKFYEGGGRPFTPFRREGV